MDEEPQPLDWVPPSPEGLTHPGELWVVFHRMLAVLSVMYEQARNPGAVSAEDLDRNDALFKQAVDVLLTSFSELYEKVDPTGAHLPPADE